MNKEDYINLFTDAIKKSDKALVFDIENAECSVTSDGVYFEFDYQIDDRIERLDYDVLSNMEKILGDVYCVSIERKNTYPDGCVAYTITIES